MHFGGYPTSNMVDDVEGCGGFLNHSVDMGAPVEAPVEVALDD